MFEQLYLPGDRRLSNVTALGSATDAAFLKDRQKQAQLFDHERKGVLKPAPPQSATGIIWKRLPNASVKRMNTNAHHSFSSERINQTTNNSKPMQRKESNMKIKNTTEIAPYPIGRKTIHPFAALVAAGTLAGAIAFSQSAREIRGPSPYVEITNEPPPKLIVDAPLPEGLSIGVFWAQYRVENLRIVPVFGAGAAQTSPRVGHLHVQVDDLPWWWADASDSNTIDIGGLTPGQHKVKIWLVGADHNDFPGQVQTLKFTIPEYDREKVYGHGH